MNAAILPIRHGDVILWPIERADTAKLKVIEGGKSGVTLTRGSATGHEHAVRGAAVYDEDGGSRIVVAGDDAVIVHDGADPRHKPVPLAPMAYRQSIKRQADGADGWSSVQD